MRLTALLFAILLLCHASASWAAYRIVFISGGQLYSMTPTGGELTKLTTTGADSVVANRDGKLVAFHGKDGITIYDPATGAKRVMPMKNTIAPLAFSADAKSLYFTQQPVKGGESVVYRVDLDGKNQRSLGLETLAAEALSPDGQWVVEAGENTLYLTSTSADATKDKTLKMGKVMDEYEEMGDPVFSPDGRHIVFALTTSGDYEHGDLYTIATDGTSLKCLVKIQDGKKYQVDSAIEPHYSPDSKWIIFDGWQMWGPDPDKETAQGIYVIKSDGSGRRLLAKLNHEDADSCFSPDSKSIAFVKGGDVWVINLDGSGLRQLTKKHHNSAPVWVVAP